MVHIYMLVMRNTQCRLGAVFRLDLINTSTFSPDFPLAFLIPVLFNLSPDLYMLLRYFKK
jgi:hypothetical protein